METAQWPAEWLRGVLDLCVLAVLAEGPTYGYAISARLDGLGLGAVKGGTLYPLLTRLEKADLVTTQWRPGVGGPGRKYFALTTLGRDELHRLGSGWRMFTEVTTQIVDGRPDTTPGSGDRGPGATASPSTTTATHATATPSTTQRSAR